MSFFIWPILEAREKTLQNIWITFWEIWRHQNFPEINGPLKAFVFRVVTFDCSRFGLLFEFCTASWLEKIQKWVKYAPIKVGPLKTIAFKGQLISKWLFCIFTFFQKTNKTSRQLVKSYLFVRFFGRNVGLNYLP